jgi:hypothetical protein
MTEPTPSPEIAPPAPSVAEAPVPATPVAAAESSLLRSETLARPTYSDFKLPEGATVDSDSLKAASIPLGMILCEKELTAKA